MELYKKIARDFQAYKSCEKTGNTDWFNKWVTSINEAVFKNLPYGSGFDNGTRFDFDNSTSDKLIFNSSFHKLDENGFYDGWIDFNVKVTPSLAFGCNIDIVGKFGNRQDLKEYIGDTFNACLKNEVPEFSLAK